MGKPVVAMTDRTRVAFVCVRNAGRSQMATAFAERERTARGLDPEVGIVTGGTDPAEHVHEVVIEAMAERGIDVSDREPRAVTPEELSSCEYVITMGCSASDVCPAGWGGENRDWGLEDPGERSIETVQEIRDDIEGRVADLFDELESSRA
jgi:protein-tyrosine-phosphatase